MAEETPPEKTEEELKVDKDVLAARANEMITKDGPLNACCMMQIMSRQFYYCALTSMRERLLELGEKDINNMEQVLIGAMSDRAMQGFDRKDVLQKVQSIGLPWLMATIAAEDQKEAQLAKEEFRDAAAVRREQPIPIFTNYCLSDGSQRNNIPDRSRPLIFAGQAQAVHIMLTRARARAEHVTTIRLSLSSSPPQIRKPKKKQQNRDIVFSQWAGKAESPKKFAKFMAPWFRDLKDGFLDLLIIDDLVQVSKPLIAGTHPLRVASQGLRNVRKWAEEVGCAVLAGIPGSDWELPDILSKEWEDLEIYSDLIKIKLVDGPFDKDYEWETYEIHMGAEDCVGSREDRSLFHRKVLE